MSTALKIANLIKSTEDVIELELDTSANTISRKTGGKKTNKKQQTAGQELSDYNQRAVKAAVGKEKQALSRTEAVQQRLIHVSNPESGNCNLFVMNKMSTKIVFIFLKLFGV